MSRLTSLASATIALSFFAALAAGSFALQVTLVEAKRHA